jgi:murein DD-endopeptidase MepM/ murein hydrolase activator NlpD
MRLPVSCPRSLHRAAAVLLLLCASLPRIVAAQSLYHVLEKGETLYSIARAYGVKPEAIATANSIDDPSKLRVGRKLLIPRAGASAGATATASSSGGAELLSHRVLKGETLFSIARSYGIGLDALRSANKLGPSSIIRVGELLLVPGGRAPLAAATPAPAPTSAMAAPAATQGAPATRDAPATGLPEPVKTSARATDKSLSWPCSGEIRYLDGKAYGVVIKARQGEAMKAVAAGTVSSAGPYRGYGNVVFVLSRGYIYVYGGNESISVRAGDQIVAGQELGKVGMDSNQGGPAAYFLVFKSGAAVDPASAPRD